ncbi:uncharacterized protein TNCV_3929831 [Trichonephila clavipes]|nr:uncharacterized protein TNCV_3929831 [Trichonephila clavipes]
MKMRVLNRSRQNDRLHVMLVKVYIDITPLHTLMPVSRRIGERTIPYSWRACKQSTIVLQRVAVTSGILSGESICLLPTGNIRYCGANYISHDHDRNEGLFSSVMCRNVPEEVVLVECSSESEVRFHLSYVTKIDRFGNKGNLVCCSIMLGCRTPLYIFDVSSATL